MNNDDLDDLFTLNVTIKLEIPGGWIIGSSLLAALTEILNHLEHDGIRPTHTTNDITEQTTR
jgi:hypothetical protein